MAIIQQVIRQPDGTLATVSFDTLTGKQTEAAAPTTNSFASSLEALGLSPTQEAPTPAKQTVAESEIKKPKEELASNGRGERGATGYSTSAGPSAAAGPSKGFGDNTSSGISWRTASNNYGYTNKPTALGFAGMLPGVAGLAGKAINMGINASNTAATNKARESLGLGKKGFGANVGSTISDKKGHVADVQIGTGQFSVGLEAQDQYGRTTLTPTEAQNRARALKSDIVEATPAQSKSRRASFAKENPGASGFFGRVKEGVTSIFSGIFGPKGVTPGTVANSVSASNPQGISIGSGGFPSAPTAAKGSTQGSSQYGGFSSAAAQSRGESISPGASKSIGAGKGGLY
jgi:hypothetical protein